MRRRRLSGEEDALWTKATKDVRPLAPPRAPVASGAMRASDAKPMRASAPAPPLPPPPRERARAVSVFDAGDPKVDRRARRGRIEIDAALDLHGLGQAAAHTALCAFLGRAHRRHLRCVLVVTGKGEGAVSAPFSDTSPRGILKARFLDWMNEPHLRAIVARAAPAAPRHGGQGAFYVFLKKARI